MSKEQQYFDDGTPIFPRRSECEFCGTVHDAHHSAECINTGGKGYCPVHAEQHGDCCSAEENTKNYEAIGQEIGRLVDEKQKCYGDSFGKAGAVMRILYPGGISLDQIDDALCVVRIIDKLFRIATARDALGESPYRDISGYGMLGAARSK